MSARPITRFPSFSTNGGIARRPPVQKRERVVNDTGGCGRSAHHFAIASPPRGEIKMTLVIQAARGAGHIERAAARLFKPAAGIAGTQARSVPESGPACPYGRRRSRLCCGWTLTAPHGMMAWTSAADGKSAAFAYEGPRRKRPSNRCIGQSRPSASHHFMKPAIAAPETKKEHSHDY